MRKIAFHHLTKHFSFNLDQTTFVTTLQNLENKIAVHMKYMRKTAGYTW